MKNHKINSVLSENPEELQNRPTSEFITEESIDWNTRERYNIGHLTKNGIEDLLKLKEKLIKAEI